MVRLWSRFRRQSAVAVVLSSVSNMAYSLALPSIPLDRLASHANSYASANGLQIEAKNDDGISVYQCAPISLLPNAYPREAFQQAQELAGPFNELVDRISRDGDFLKETLGGGVAEADPYTGKLLQLYEQIYMNEQFNYAQSADRLGIHRSDYMLNAKEGDSSDEYELKQVELNTIAASFAGLASNVANLHRHLTGRFASQVQELLSSNKNIIAGSTDPSPDDGVPQSPALTCIPEAMAIAHQRYKERYVAKEDGEANPIVLFVVQEGETNTVDQRMLEFRLWELYDIPVVRMSLTRAETDLHYDETNGQIYVETEGTRQQVAVVYFRAGYAPTDYPDGYDGIEWKWREQIERSVATKCPSLGYHLAGTKKVQQELARPGVLERFFPDEPDKVGAMREAFAGLYSLGSDATDQDLAAVRDVVESNAEGRYVLKPQREGGGYNYYGQDLAEKLKANVGVGNDGTLTLDKELAEFILMERLFPPKQPAVLLRSGKVEGTGDSISELGCFGALVVSNEGEVVHNKYAGFLLRTKFSNVDEGGVASGFATLSSPYLC